MTQATAICNPHRPRAIGYLRTDLSGHHHIRHTDAIRQLARRRGQTLIYVVRLQHDSAPDPTSSALDIVRGIGATTLIVPDLAHVGDLPGPVCEVCDLITVCPEQLWTKTHSAAGDSTPEPVRLPEDWHSAPDSRLALAEAHRTMQAHRACNPLDCPRKAAAFTRLAEAGKLVPATRSPRQRAAARAIPYPPAEPTIARPSPPLDVLRRLLTGLDRA